jgi:hypothetical protein
MEARPLFDPEPVKPRALFEEETAKPAPAALFSPAAASSLMFDDAPKSKPLFGEEKPRTPVDIDQVGKFYQTHPLLHGRSEDFIELVRNVDQSMKLSSSSAVLQFGYQVKQNASIVINNILALNLKMMELRIPESGNKIISSLTGLKLDQYIQSNKKAKFDNYLAYYRIIQAELDSLLSELSKKIEALILLANNVDDLFAANKSLIDEVDAYNIAGKIIIERSERALFDKPEDYLIDQFKQKAFGFAESQTVIALNIIQIKNTQSNLMKLAVNCQNIVDTIYPLWKSEFSATLSLWQTKGGNIMSSSLVDLMSDQESVKANTVTDNLIQRMSNFLK